MELLPVFVVVMTTVVYQTGALQCPSCNYAELPQELANLAAMGGDASFGDFGTDVKCKDGGSSIMTRTCSSAGSGKKNVCISAKARINMEFEVQGSKANIGMTMYSRDCHDVSTTKHPGATGDIDIDEFKNDINSMFEDMNSGMDSGIPGMPTMSIKVTSVNGGVEYCSTSNCGKTESIAKLGAAGTVPSLLLLGVLTAVACFFSR